MLGEILLLQPDRGPVGERGYPGAADLQWIRMRKPDAEHNERNAR